MKKFQTILSVSIIAILTSFVLYSCEDDDICTDEGEVPRMVADMYYDGTNVPLEDSIYYWAYVYNDSITKGIREASGTSKDTVLIESSSVLEKSSFAIALRNNTKKEIYYTIAQGPDIDVKDSVTGKVIRTIPAKRDRLILKYDTIGNGYTSKACGFGLTFKGVDVKLVTKTTNSSGNWIKKIETVNTEIKDGSTTVIKLFANERN
ncbi:hypothetical protein HXZ94_10005 [Empedobacter falsenii]|uniref:DUF6452 family protein n=1 Tax=Empedobacter falsenii TaxID=343874 RepID=UPI00257888F1|nr:DUF6452 family protein [Empedobacter falsenii]MDM1298833.1 hypothetical protein [Empedobacter falsenii]MDM1318557.1 hypothetical protein [Empedobacter falsenii]